MAADVDHWCDSCKVTVDPAEVTDAGGHEWEDYTCWCRCEDRIETETCDGPVLPHAEALAKGMVDWVGDIPWDAIEVGLADGGAGARFRMRGHDDPPEDAIVVRVVRAAKKPPDQMAYESVVIGLKWTRCYDVVDGGGNPRVFERRPLYQVKGCLWNVTPAKQDANQKAST